MTVIELASQLDLLAKDLVGGLEHITGRSAGSINIYETVQPNHKVVSELEALIAKIDFDD